MKITIVFLIGILAGCADMGPHFVVHNRDEYMRLMVNCMNVHTPTMPVYEASARCEEIIGNVSTFAPDGAGTDRNESVRLMVNCMNVHTQATPFYEAKTRCEEIINNLDTLLPAKEQ